MADLPLHDLLEALAPINADPATISEREANARAERLQAWLLRDAAEQTEVGEVLPLRKAGCR